MAVVVLIQGVDLHSTLMASVAGRKKSIMSGVEQPVANNTLLNKAAAQSTSLYQECSALRARLIRVVNFAQYFALASSQDSRQSTDPVTQIWDVFTLGISLVYLYNLLPPSVPKIPLDTSIVNFDQSQDKHKKRAIIQFSIQMKDFPNAELFTVTDLWDRNSTDGLVKVSSTHSPLQPGSHRSCSL
jgi:cell division control protein 24